MAKVIQFTGLSGAGKTTLANGVQQELSRSNYKVAVLDGDVYRKTLCSDLGFSKSDRIENIKRLGRLAMEMSDDYDFIIIAAINPFQIARQWLRDHLNAKLVYITCAIETLTIRDTKDLYRRAMLPKGHENKIYNLTGVNDYFEPPLAPDFIISTETDTVTKSIEKLKSFMMLVR
ncbi:adenylyl-sulfate kinase [Pedobacter endophyticus]|uniref:Adenylyl-sulfate kinase n=1 Tax=Pedobacter endophyticus TaxID=2789740 RepID=A0A7U3SPA0_9SPHI|nr:adenylyl-sulfate kinase [Pedobacter endophyticus]QPH37836.1 adenylyl-sulfate kinase [Pedobacter endophyticus]